ncbi:taste receptor type 2 member 3-like [Macrotis lagotis]|uniref:taste receptor type 2 member 3-like n=1 Tax=Macrotis lagotis TaxID=92651 RepID=UPI003D69C396
MLNPFQTFFLFMTFSEFILGIWVNGFLGLFNCIHWIKRRKISLSDFIIMNLAFSRIILQCVITSDGTILVIYPDFYNEKTLNQIREISWTFTNYLSIWLATCLSIFYCLKIANFSHPAFLWLKWRISQVITCILLCSVFLCLFNTMLLIQKFKIYSNLLQMSNDTENVRRKESELKVFHILAFSWTLIPFIISLFSCILLILSLRRHTRMMKHYKTDPRDISTEAHVRATKVMFSFLFFFVFYCILMLMGTSSYFLKDTKMIILIIELVSPVYPSVHSVILILQNKNLKQAFLGLLWLKGIL